MRVKIRINITCVFRSCWNARRGQFQQPLKTQVILILNFTSTKCDDFVVNKIESRITEFLNALKLRQSIVGREHRCRNFLNLRASFFQSPTFWNRPFTTPCYSSCFHFRSCPLILRYITCKLSRNETPLAEQQTNHECLPKFGQTDNTSSSIKTAIVTKQLLDWINCC